VRGSLVYTLWCLKLASLSRNWTRYPISEKDFRSGYASICAHGRDGIGATNPHDVRFLPLLFVVLAISARLSLEHIGGDARTRRITSLRYYWSCQYLFVVISDSLKRKSARRSLLIAAAIQPDSLEIVLTRLLVGLVTHDLTLLSDHLSRVPDF